MSGLLYGRSVEVQVGIPGQAGGSRKLTGLRVIFKIEKTSEPHPNKSEIEIYNLSKNTRDIMVAKGSVIILKAGYGHLGEAEETAQKIKKKSTDPVLGSIFVGDLDPPARVNTRREKGDWITKVESGDGLNAYLNKDFTGSFGPGAKTGDIFGKIADSMDLPLGDVDGVEGDEFIQGFSFSGMSRDAMDTITGKTKTEWSIQNGALQVLPLNKAIKAPVIFLSSNSGLLESPNKTKKGIEFKSLLQPGLAPGQIVQIESLNIKGFYVVRKVTHKGDSHQDKFTSECEAIALT